MSADPAHQHQLYQALCTAIGAENTETLMSQLLPDHVAELATKDDLRALGAELRGEMGELRGEFKADLARQSRQHLIATITTMLATATLAFAAAATLG